MQLERTLSQLELVESLSSSYGAHGPISAFLAQYLAVVLYSEMEEKVTELVKSHLQAFTHASLGQFISSSLNDLIKRLPKSDLARLLERFGDEFKSKFNERIEERKVTAYSNIIAARHDIGHKRGSNITLAEVRLGIDGGNHILSALKECLQG